MTDEKLYALYKSWHALVEHKDKMGRTLLELIAHPDAKEEDIAAAVPKYKDTVGMLREHRPKILEALRKGKSWHVLNAYNEVKNTRL